MHVAKNDIMLPKRDMSNRTSAT